MRVLIGVAVVLVVGACSRQATATTMSIQPTSTSVNVGDSVSLNVDISLSAGTDLYGYQFDVQFNPAVLQANDIIENSFLSGAGATLFLAGSIDNGAGVISLNANTLLTAITGATGSGTLATINFSTTGAGSSNVMLANVILLDSTLTPIDFTSESASVRAVTNGAAVPEPATWLLVAAGVAAIRRIVPKRPRIV